MSKFRRLLGNQGNYRTVVGVRIDGNVDSKTLAAIAGKIRHKQVGLESQQIQEVAKEEALLSLFVFKPRQTGMAAVAAATAAAINDPSGTAITVLEGTDPDERIEHDTLLQELLKHTDNVFTTPEEAIEYVNSVSEVPAIEGD